MSDWKKLCSLLVGSREQVLTKPGVAERERKTIRSEPQPDYEAVAYAGMDDRDYPLWQHETLRDEWLYLFDVELEDYGYDVEGSIADQELPKASSDGDIGAVKYAIELIDRFGCQIILRGHLKGSSFELNFDIALRLSIFGCSHGGLLGFAGETLAEGYAFELEGRSKQAFFCYFSALESVIEGRRRALCGDGESSAIPYNDRLPDKLGKLVVATVPEGHGGLNSIPFWGSLMTRFKAMELLRNAIAHNEKHETATKADAAEAFVALAIIVAMLHGGGSSVFSMLDYYRIDPDRAAGAARKDRRRSRRL